MTVSAAVLAVILSSATVKAEDSGAARIGAMAPSFGGWALGGRNVLTLDALRSSPTRAPLIISFGASWCVACAKGLPRLVAISRKHSDVRFVYVSVEADAEKARAFARRVGFEGPAILDKFGVIAKTYGVSTDETTSLPRTFLLDAKGRIRAIYGAEGEDFDNVLETDLTKLVH